MAQKRIRKKLNHEVIIPTFPTPENQSLDSWKEVMKSQTIDENTVIVAHSLGPSFALSLLEENKAHSCYFVAGFIGLLNHEIDKINESISNKSFDWQTIRNNCEKFYLFNADNDPYVPLAKGQELSDFLGAKLTIIKGAGHFNESAGYIKFERLLEEIKENISC